MNMWITVLYVLMGLNMCFASSLLFNIALRVLYFSVICCCTSLYYSFILLFAVIEYVWDHYFYYWKNVTCSHLSFYKRRNDKIFTVTFRPWFGTFSNQKAFLSVPSSKVGYHHDCILFIVALVSLLHFKNSILTLTKLEFRKYS